jgi:hypothetical protein
MPGRPRTFWQAIGWENLDMEISINPAEDELLAALRDLERQHRAALGAIANPPSHDGDPRYGWTREQLEESRLAIAARIEETKAAIRRLSNPASVA